MKRIVAQNKALVVAADVSGENLEELASALVGVSGVGAFKTGFDAAYESGIKKAVSSIKKPWGNDIIVIHDFQKGGTDIPPLGEKYAKSLFQAEVDAAILFPFAGPETQEKWTVSLQDVGIQVITGMAMTHPRFFQSEGGYIPDEAPEAAFELACELGGRHFVVPGNKLDWVTKLRNLLIKLLGEGEFALYAPGFIDQGGDLTECGKAAGDNWHPIVGGAIYKNSDPRSSAMNLCSKLGFKN